MAHRDINNMSVVACYIDVCMHALVYMQERKAEAQFIASQVFL